LKRAGQKLSEGGKNTVSLFSLVKIGKELDSVGAEQSPLLAQLRASIEPSDVVGLGSFSNFGHPSWRVNEIMADEILPSQTFRNMKFFFAFATACQIVM
jgi:hypothetical protein